MVSKLTFLGLSLAVLALQDDLTDTTCQVYDCADSKQVTGSQCSSQDSNTSTVYFKHCPSDQICSYQPPDNTSYKATCQNPSAVTVSVVGEYCGTMNNVSYTCGTGLTCTSNKCVLASGYTATSTLHCTPGTYYDTTSKTCINNVASGAACTADEQCAGDQLCFSTVSGGAATCQDVKSVDNGKMFYVTAGQYVPAGPTQWGSNLYIAYPCEDLIAYSSNGTTFTCTKRPELDFTKTCTSDTQCTLKDLTTGVGSSYSDCMCSHNSAGASYCSISFGDSAGDDYVDEIEDFADSSDAKKCNSGNKFSSGCYQLKGSSDFKKLQAKAQHATYNVSIKHAKSCAIETLYPTYWSEDSASYLFATALLLAFAQHLVI